MIRIATVNDAEQLNIFKFQFCGTGHADNLATSCSVSRHSLYTDEHKYTCL